MATGLTPDVKEAIEELKISFPLASVEVVEAGDGGAHVFMDPVDPGSLYQQQETWIGFAVGFQYPYSDIYPLFVRPDLTRLDGAALGEGISNGHSFQGRPAIQLSRRNNKLNPVVDTAALKVTKVLAWLRDGRT